MGVSGTYAVGSGTSSTNVFSTGAVDIELKQYTINENNQEILYENQYSNVIPNQEISLIEKIQNKAANCYVRAKITFVDDDGQNIDLTIFGMPEGWKKIGEYYYYESSLNTEDEITIFEKIKMPQNLNQQSSKAILQVIVEAVQADNFSPNYETENPWNNVAIQKCIRNNYEIDENQDSNKTIIELENNTNNYIKVPDNFLNHVDKMMPGDNKFQELTIENTDKKSAEFFLNIKTTNLTQEQQELLKRITLKITKSNGEKIFNGSLAEINNISLGKYKKNEGEKLLFIVQIPENLPNEYAGINPNIIWNFSAKYEEENIFDKISNPKTGDFKFDLSLILFFTATVGLAVVLVLIKAEKKNTKN